MSASSLAASLHDVTRAFPVGNDRCLALDRLSLDIVAHEFTVVMGPSGSGKSTLLNIIGCLDRPSSGEYLLEGRRVSDQDFDDLAEIRNYKIGFIFQSFNLIPVLDVIENIEFPCAVRQNPEEAGALRARVEKLESLSRLAAGLGHEINTPLQFVGDNLGFLAGCTVQCALMPPQALKQSLRDLGLAQHKRNKKPGQCYALAHQQQHASVDGHFQHIYAQQQDGADIDHRKQQVRNRFCQHHHLWPHG